MKIVLLESLGIRQETLNRYAEKLAENGHSFEAYEKNTDPAFQIQKCKDADVIMLANMPLTGDVIRACDKLRFIDIAFTGVDHVDLSAAKEKGIAVSNASGYSNQSVAELVLGMAISLLRNIPQTDARCREGKTKDGLVGRELRGKTVGIIGLGAIGSKTAAIFNMLGCEILAYSRRPRTDKPDYVKYVSLEELMATSDIVSLHCPLTDETRNLIGKEQISLMKKDAILINAARGPVVDMQALADALNRGEIGGAGIDVYEKEPPLDPNHPLLHSANTIATPHVAFATAESMELRAEIVFRSLDEWLSGNQINKVI